MCQFFHNVKNRVILWCLLLYADAEGQWRFCSLSYMDASFLYTVTFVFLWLFSFFPNAFCEESRPTGTEPLHYHAIQTTST